MIVDIVKNGRSYKVQVPNDAPAGLWPAGIIIGPPDLAGLSLPPIIETRLHNELFARGLITERDIRKRMPELQAALMAALKVDVNTIMEAYQNGRSGR